MRICLSHNTAAQFWLSSYAAAMAGKLQPFYRNDTAGRPTLRVPGVLPAIPRVTAEAGIKMRACSSYVSLEKCIPTSKNIASASLLLPSSTSMHVLVSDRGKRRPSVDAEQHVCSYALPPSSIISIGENIAVVSPELAFVQMAESLTFVELVAFGYEICGYYSTARGPGGSIPGKKELHEYGSTLTTRNALTTAQSIRDFIDSLRNVPGLKLARRAAAHLLDGSNSPGETSLSMLLTLPKHVGGYGLSKPQLNGNIYFREEGAPIDECRTCDLLWRSGKLDVEYQGTEYHATRAQQTKDARRPDDLKKLGFICMFVTQDRMANMSDMDRIAAEIAKRIGCRIRPIDAASWSRRKIDLRQQLIFGVGRNGYAR